MTAKVHYYYYYGSYSYDDNNYYCYCYYYYYYYYFYLFIIIVRNNGKWQCLSGPNCSLGRWNHPLNKIITIHWITQKVWIVIYG